MKHLTKLLLPIALALPLFASAAIYNPESVGSLVITDIENDMAIGILKIPNIGTKDRFLFASKKDYRKLNIRYRTDVLADARIYLIRAQDGSALLRINNLRRIKHDFYVVLKDPQHGYLYGWKIRASSEGQFEASLSRTMNYKSVASLPKTRKAPRSVRSVQFPVSPQPQLQRGQNKYTEQSSVKEPAQPTNGGILKLAKVDLNNQPTMIIQGVSITPVSLKLKDPSLTAFAKLATRMLPDLLLTEENNEIHLQQITETIALSNGLNKSSMMAFNNQTVNGFKTVAYNGTNTNSPMFGWTNAIVYRVNEDDMSLDKIIRAVSISQTTSTDAAMAATYLINKKSFGSASIYILKKGAILHMPPQNMIDELASNPSRMKEILASASGTTSIF